MKKGSIYILVGLGISILLEAILLLLLLLTQIFKDVFRIIIWAVFWLIILSWIIYGIIWLITNLRQEKIEEKKNTWGTDKCVDFVKSYIYFKEKKEVEIDSETKDSIETHSMGFEKPPLYVIRVTARYYKTKYAMIIRTDKIVLGEDFEEKPLHFSLKRDPTEEEIKEAIQNILPEKPKKKEVGMRKIDPVTGKVAEETYATEDKDEEQDDGIDLKSKEDKTS